MSPSCSDKRKNDYLRNHRGCDRARGALTGLGAPTGFGCGPGRLPGTKVGGPPRAGALGGPEQVIGVGPPPTGLGQPRIVTGPPDSRTCDGCGAAAHRTWATATNCGRAIYGGRPAADRTWAAAANCGSAIYRGWPAANRAGAAAANRGRAIYRGWSAADRAGAAHCQPQAEQSIGVGPPPTGLGHPARSDGEEIAS